MKKPCNSCEYSKQYILPNNKTRYYCGIWVIDNVATLKCDKKRKYDEFLEKRRKYEKGERIRNIQEYLSLKEQGETLFYWNNCIRHFGWLESLQFRTLLNSINQGRIYRAIRKNKKITLI